MHTIPAYAVQRSCHCARTHSQNEHEKMNKRMHAIPTPAIHTSWRCDSPAWHDDEVIAWPMPVKCDVTTTTDDVRHRRHVCNSSTTPSYHH